GLAFDLRNLAVVRLRQGRLAEARDLLDRASDLNQQAGGRYNGLQIALARGELELAENHQKEAAAAFTQAIGEALAVHVRDAEWRANFGLGVAWEAEPVKARGAKEKALSVIESLGPQREETHSEQERVNLLTPSRLRESLATLYAKNGEVEALWSLLERIRLK